MFASIATVEVVGSSIASVSENAIYSATLSFMNGFVFLSMAAFVSVNLSLLMWVCGDRDLTRTSIPHTTSH